MVLFKNVKKIYSIGDILVKALDGIDITINEGEYTAVMGASGSGKSTFLHLLGGVDRPTSGEIWISGKCISKMNDTEITLFRRDKIGFVFQSFNLMPTLTVEENILLPLLISGQKTNEYLKKIKELIYVLGLEGREKHKPWQLSGGQQQRVAIARAFATDPNIILLDEPTGNLDSKNGEITLELVSTMHKKYRKTIIMVTHSIFAAEHAESTIFLKDGNVVNRISKKENSSYSAKSINDIMLAI